MSMVDKRLSGWFWQHPEALPEGYRTSELTGLPALTYRTAVYPHGTDFDEPTRYALTMALLRWVAERFPLQLNSPVCGMDRRWKVGTGTRLPGNHEDITVALLDAAEALEENI
jgi:hypothetical protein